MMFWLTVTAQEAGAGGRSGAVGILVHGSRISTAPDLPPAPASWAVLPPAPASWAVPANENITKTSS